METTDAFDGLACAECDAAVDARPGGRCPECGGSLDVTYSAAEPTRATVEDADSMWDLPLLPVARRAAVTAEEGGTPAVAAPRLADELGVGRVLLKDESRNPTGSVYDRGMSLAVSAVRDTEGPLALASPGNSAQSMAAYAGRLDRRSYAFVPSRTPFPNKALINVHGGEMRVVPGRFDDARAAVGEELAASYRSLAPFDTPYRHEGAKTLAPELLAALEWDPPAAVFLPAATGELLVGLVKGFRECRDRGLVDGVPPVYGVQASGCGPMAAAFEADRSVEPWSTPDTIVGELEIPDPPGGDRAVAAVRGTGGELLAVDDDDILESAVRVAGSETVEMGAMGGAAAAGTWARADRFGPDDDVVVVNTESAAKTPDILRSHLMGQGV